MLATGAAAEAKTSHAASAFEDPVKSVALDIPSTSFRLANGLTVVVHEDHSAPLVAVNIWYHVGSKNEPEGRSGFAHLFEHLMFNGSENFNDDFFKATQKLGATEQNGSTDWDRTNYYQIVPKGALDAMLWLESDRMGHLLGAIDQAKLDEQRNVVKNEKRQSENQPYARAWGLIARATAPAEHPYHHLTIGSMTDLDAASLDDVRDWFETYYGPSNAVLVLAGDITPEETRTKAQAYFGDIGPGEPVSQPSSWPASMQTPIRELAYDRVAAPRLFRVWNIPNYSSADTDDLRVLASLLTGDKAARLTKRLLEDEQLATDVNAGVFPRESGGQFMITATAKPGGDLGKIEQIIDQELRKLLEAGPTPAEMARVRTSTIAAFARSLESLGQRASILAESQTYLGDAGGWKRGFERVRNATAIEIRRVGARWLSGPDYVLQILPFGDLKPARSAIDRKVMPRPEPVALASFPMVERGELQNGLKLVVARRSGLPLVNFDMVFDTGVAPDFAGKSPALARIGFDLLDEGTERSTGSQLAADLAAVGATLGARGGVESGVVSLSVLRPSLSVALRLYADIIRRPAFRPDDIARVKAEALAEIAAQKQDPSGIAARVMPTVLLGDASPYGRLITEASISSVGRTDLEAFHGRWFIPNNATLIVTGDTSLAEIRPLIEQAFAGWARGAEPQTLQPEAPGPVRAIVYLVDKPGSAQSVFRAVVVAKPRNAGDEIARRLLNVAVGGSFTSRLNMKLREEKGWSYGASSRFGIGRGSRLFFTKASVQTDKTADAMRETAAILNGLVKDRPLDAVELQSAKDELLLRLSSDWSTTEGLADALTSVATDRLPPDYYVHYPHEVAGRTLEAVHAAAAELFGKRPLTWIVVGHRARIERPIRELGLGDLRIIDADGNILD